MRYRVAHRRAATQSGLTQVLGLTQMYSEGREVLEQGLSRGASVLLGVVAALMSAGMALMAPSSNSPPGFYLFALFSGAIAVACFFTGRIRHWTGRGLGAAVFALSAWYLFGQISDGVAISGSRSEPSILNAVILLFVAGIPGLLFALLGRFNLRKRQEAKSEP
jgi:hypothetical protein